MKGIKGLNKFEIIIFCRFRNYEIVVALVFNMYNGMWFWFYHEDDDSNNAVHMDIKNFLLSYKVRQNGDFGFSLSVLSRFPLWLT
jgi:hypothetical protein